MSTAVVSGCTVQILLQYKLDDQLLLNTFHYQATGLGTPPPVNMSQVMTKWETLYWAGNPPGATNAVRDFMSDQALQCTLIGQLVFGTGSRSIQEIYALSPNHGNVSDGDPLPTGNSIVFRRKGSLAGRKYQGRFYLGAVPAAYVVNSAIEPTSLAIANGIAFNMDAPMVFGTDPNTLTLTPCLWKPGSAPATAAIGLTHSVNQQVRYQRRREVGVGQ